MPTTTQVQHYQHLTYLVSSLRFLDNFEANLRHFITSSVITSVCEEREFYLNNKLLFGWVSNFSKKNHTNIWLGASDIDMFMSENKICLSHLDMNLFSFMWINSCPPKYKNTYSDILYRCSEEIFIIKLQKQNYLAVEKWGESSLGCCVFQVIMGSNLLFR